MDDKKDEYLEYMANQSSFSYDFLEQFSKLVITESSKEHYSLERPTDWDGELKELMGEGE